MTRRIPDVSAPADPAAQPDRPAPLLPRPCPSHRPCDTHATTWGHGSGHARGRQVRGEGGRGARRGRFAESRRER
eukprot:361323-Chlamydomonas_euryale.AAC.14